MTTPPARQYRAGQTIEDHCRACHADRTHTIIVVDEAGQPLRVSCGFCGSDHLYRGGPRERALPDERRDAGTTPAAAAKPSSDASALITSPERRPAPVSQESGTDLETLLRRVIREETGLTPVTLAEKWRGGDLVLRPGKPGVQEKRWPIETFFHKIVMIRNRLRMLEQQVNASPLPDDVKLRLQSYVTGCYGSLTSFNVLFADDDDRFTGSSQD